MQDAAMWLNAHVAFMTTLLVFVIVGVGSSFGAKATADTKPLLSALLSSIAALLLDMVKLVAAAKALYSSIAGPKDPPSLDAAKLRAKSLANPDGTAQHFSQRTRHPFRENAYVEPKRRSLVFLSPIGALLVVFTICLTVVVGGCGATAGVPTTIADGVKTYACVQAEIDHGDDTFEGIASSCGVDVVQNVVDIVGDILTAEKKPVDGGSLGVRAPTDFQQKAMAVHHAGGAS